MVLSSLGYRAPKTVQPSTPGRKRETKEKGKVHQRSRQSASPQTDHSAENAKLCLGALSLTNTEQTFKPNQDHVPLASYLLSAFLRFWIYTQFRATSGSVAILHLTVDQVSNLYTSTCTFHCFTSRNLHFLFQDQVFF